MTTDDDSAPSNATAQPKYTLEELFALQKSFYDNFLYPANIKQAEAINSTLLADNVSGVFVLFYLRSLGR